MKKKFENINELKVGSILTYFNLIISCIIPLFYTPLMLRILGQAEYGLYSLSNSVIGYLSLLTFGMGGAVSRYVTKFRVEGNHEKTERVIGMFIVIYIIFAVLVLIVGGVLPFISDDFFARGLSVKEIARLNMLIVIMTISTALSFISSVYNMIAIAYEKYIFKKLMDSLLTIAAPVLNLIVLLLGYASIGMAVVGLIMQIFNLVIFPFYCKTKLNIQAKFDHMPFYLLKEIINFTVFMFLSSIVDMLYWATDKVLIGSLVGTIGVAVYNIGGTFTSMLQNMSSAISSVFSTRVTAYVFEKRPIGDISEILIRIGRIQYYIVSLMLSGYIVFGKKFIYYWAGASYADAYYIGLMTMLPLAIPLIQNIAFATIVAQNKHRFRAIVYVIIAVINVISTYIVIPKFGILGAAVCTCVAFVIGNGIIMNVYYYKVTKLDILGFWKNIMQISVVPIGLTIISIWFFKYILIINSLQKMLIIIIFYTCIFFFLSWSVSMNEYEKNIFKNIIYRILGRQTV